MLFNSIILKCGLHIEGSRSIAAIYYLLTGKRSIQTVQDAHLFKLESFYGIYPSLNKADFDKYIIALKQQGFLDKQDASIMKLTLKGKHLLDENDSVLPFIYFKGLKYYTIDQVFFERLLLLIQVLTNRKMLHSNYIPVVDKVSVTNWLIPMYQYMKDNVHHTLNLIYQELQILLNNLLDYEASMFVDRLTGFKAYGMSIYQLAEKYKISVHDVQLLLVGITHEMLEAITKASKEFPFLALIIKDLSKSGFITYSADKTYELLKKNYPIEIIASMRQLKIHTIYDHIVEIALYDKNFAVDPYVSKAEQLEIIDAVEQTKTSKLKDIKDYVNQDISYFQIRLALAVVKSSPKSGGINE